MKSRPPDVDRPGSAAAQPGREIDSPGRRISGKNTPLCRTPQREAARAQLQRLFSPTPQSEFVAVVAVRPDGRRVLFNHYKDRISADAMVAALARVGLRAEVVGIDSRARPGTTIRPTR